MPRDRLHRLDDLNAILPPVFSVDTYSPGDGVTRYRFFDVPNGRYFADRGSFTALGYKEAVTYARGLADGWNARNEYPAD